MNKLMIALTSAVIVTTPAAAQTQGQTHASHGPAKAAKAAEDKGGCEAMAKKMGTGQQHSHAEEKGTVAHSAMNHEHMRCKAEQEEKKNK